MPSKTSFILKHKLPDNFEIIYNSLLDFKKFGDIHPHMTEVTVIQDQSPDFIEYNILEEIYLLGFIKNHPQYTAKVMEVEKNKHIRYVSPVKKNIFLTVDITFSRNARGFLTVTETMEITSNKLMGIVFSGILKKAHTKFFQNLNTLLLNSIEDVKA